MWEWLKSWFRYKQLTSEELPRSLVLEEELKQISDAWMHDRSLLNGARLELKTARKKIDELDRYIHSGDLQRKEMQERIDELENEVYSITVERNEYKTRLQNVLNQI
ncbi:hypothetical protein Novomoskovsk_57 [Bacillus phage Novomoskovsk]|uniref:Uncharacterized protein n=1 Tax=Bacillus phage Novomoskovsk TaxID=2736258 RepID=A0A6M9Z7D8_9CAUD|nr:hypothetical protein Novomoskovsk_57 [Bacillus phage Novomoskovsk]